MATEKKRVSRKVGAVSRKKAASEGKAPKKARVASKENVASKGASTSVDTREKLLRAAEELFVERGLDGVSVSDIAKKSGTTKGHLYYYFENKEQLFDAVLKEHLDAQRDMLSGVALTAGGDVKGRIHDALDAYIDFIEKNPGFPRLIQREMCSNSGSVEKIAAGMAPVHAWGAGMLAQFLPGEGPATAKHFFFSIYSMTLNYYTYAGMLERLWGIDPLSVSALAERRAHAHLMVDLIINHVLPEKPESGN